MDAATHRPRIGLGTLLWVVAAAAPVVALYAKVQDPAAALPTTLMIVLTGLAVGAARRARAWKVAAQIGLTACCGLAMYELVAMIDDEEVVLRYFPSVVFAATAIAPLMVRNALASTGEDQHRRIKAAADVLWNVFLHIVALLLFWFVLEILTQWNWMPITGRTTVRTPPPAPTYGPGLDDDLDEPVEPASLEPSTGPYPRGCEARVEPSPVLKAGAR